MILAHNSIGFKFGLPLKLTGERCKLANNRSPVQDTSAKDFSLHRLQRAVETVKSGGLVWFSSGGKMLDG